MSESPNCRPGDVQVGDKVKTVFKRQPVSWGEVVTVSECRRYVRVEKHYGCRIWSEPWRVVDLFKPRARVG